ncbi:MAG: hypothetical protein R2827_06935 [Bdellovibrionales bacterium]
MRRLGVFLLVLGFSPAVLADCVDFAGVFEGMSIVRKVEISQSECDFLEVVETSEFGREPLPMATDGKVHQLNDVEREIYYSAYHEGESFRYWSAQPANSGGYYTQTRLTLLSNTYLLVERSGVRDGVRVESKQYLFRSK